MRERRAPPIADRAAARLIPARRSLSWTGRETIGVRSGAIVSTQWGQRKSKEGQFADDGYEVDAFVFDGPCLAFGWMPLKDLAQLDLERLVDVVEAAATGRPRDAADVAADHNPLGSGLNHDVDGEQTSHDRPVPDLGIGKRKVCPDRAPGPGSPLEFDDVDDEGRLDHQSSWSKRPSER